MESILSLDYERFLCDFRPQSKKEDAKILSKFNQQLGSEFIARKDFYEYSVSAPRSLHIHVAYKISDSIPNLINTTTSLLEDTAKTAGLKGEDYFALNSSRVIPFDIYEAEVHKQIIGSLMKQIGLGN